MNLYNVTLWNHAAVVKGVETGEYVYLAIVAPNDMAALREVRKYKGEITNFKLALSNLIVV